MAVNGFIRGRRDFAQQEELLVRQLAKLLAGKSPALQGVVLADLTAIWIRGHGIKDDSAATDRRREELLTLQTATIQSLLRLPS